MTPKQGQKLIPDEKRKKNQLAVRLTDSELKALERISKQKRLPISHLIREGIAAVIERYSK